MPRGTDDPRECVMVEPVRPGRIVATAPLPRDGAKAGDSRFSVDESGTPVASATHASATASLGLDGMLTLQAVDERDERDRAARRRGFALLSGLTNLQRAMLAGADSTSVLRVLEEISEEPVAADDPRLEAILKAVVLRSRVELARRRRAK
jgi:hypothetical protein